MRTLTRWGSFLLHTAAVPVCDRPCAVLLLGHGSVMVPSSILGQLSLACIPSRGLHKLPAGWAYALTRYSAGCLQTTQNSQGPLTAVQTCNEAYRRALSVEHCAQVGHKRTIDFFYDAEVDTPEEIAAEISNEFALSSTDRDICAAALKEWLAKEAPNSSG